MRENRITVTLYLHRQKKSLDLDVPLDISANELIVALAQGLRLDINIDDLSQCYLKAERPICLLRGNKTLGEYGLRNGTELHYTT